MVVKIGNAQGFWGDNPNAPANLIAQQPDLDYLTLDYLSEVSLSIMAIQQEKDPTLGYAKDFLDVIRSLVPFWKNGSKVKVIANAGGLNPEGCAQACKQIYSDLKIGIVAGDNVLSLLKTEPAQPLFVNLDTKEPIIQVKERLVTANAYLGAQAIVEVLDKGAQVVITGRIADPSLTVAPCVAYYRWKWDEWDRLAGATIAGHLIECGTQVTGGISTNWLSLQDPAHIGFPVVEVFSNGTCIITKPLGTAGNVSQETVKEQLLYEIGDPDNYLSPDVIVSFLALQLTNDGIDRIRIEGAKGKPPPDTYKVSATYKDGFKSEATLAIFGQQAYEKGRRCGEVILQRIKDKGFIPDRFNIECIGCGGVVPGLFANRDSLECLLRVAIADSRKEVLECFTREIAPLVTSGPQGVTGYISGRPSIRSIFGYWPCLINKANLKPINYLL